MRRSFCVVLIVSTLCISVVLLFLLKNKVKLNVIENAEIIFVYENMQIYEPVNEQELLMIQSILDGKFFYADNLSCGFSKQIALRINGEYTFCFARDACPILYWDEKDVYIQLTEEEKGKLHNLIEKYGGIFPCL